MARQYHFMRYLCANEGNTNGPIRLRWASSFISTSGMSIMLPRGGAVLLFRMVMAFAVLDREDRLDRERGNILWITWSRK